MNGRSFPSVLLWQEIDAPSSDATGFVCASTRTSCRVINARQSQHKRQPDKALPLPRCPITPFPSRRYPAHILIHRMKVPLSVGLLTITHAIDTDTATATGTNTDTDTLTATATVTATAMATASAPALAPAPAPNTSYSCRTFLAPSWLLLRLGAFTHYCVYIFCCACTDTKIQASSHTHNNNNTYIYPI